MRNIRVRLQLLTVVFASLLCSVACALPVHAATSNAASFNLTTSPVYVTLTTKPGQTVSTPIRVQNNASKVAVLQVKLMKFRTYGNDGKAELLTPSSNDSSVKWVTFSKTSIVAQPGVWNTVAMTIQPDHTAAFGYYYAVVFTQAGQDNKPASNVNTVSGSSAVLVLLDVQVPGEKRQLGIDSFKPEHKISEFLPANFNVVVKNTGDIYGAPTGDIYISRNKKDTLAALPVNEAGGNILPNSSRNFTVTWNDGFPAHEVKRINGQIVTTKDGRPATQLSWASSKLGKFRFGRYYAHLLLVYNNGKQDVPVEAEATFWVIPWRILLAALLILTLVIFGLVTFIRRGVHLGRKVVKRTPKSEKPKPEV